MSTNINSENKSIILSAHCDDVPLSLGGCLLGKLFKIKPTVIIIFPITKYIHDDVVSMSEEEVTHLRIEEERNAAKIANYNVKFLKFQDAFCRPDYNDYSLLFQKNQKFRDPIYPIIVKKLKKILENYEGLICAPLAIGDHIDHKILYSIALKLLNEIPEIPLLFYEDLPYAEYIPNSKLEEIIKNIKKIFDVKPFIFKNFNIDDKINLLKIYQTQMDSEQFDMVKHYWDSIGKGERIWLTKTANKYLKNEIIEMS